MTNGSHILKNKHLKNRNGPIWSFSIDANSFSFLLFKYTIYIQSQIQLENKFKVGDKKIIRVIIYFLLISDT